ncbi:MAG: hypothetical protein ACE367_14020 [Acidimicrobiales bacterium]
MRVLATVLAVIFLVALIGCGNDDAPSARAVSLFELIEEQNDAVSYGSAVYETLAEAMPNFLYETDSGELVSAADLYVAGRVASVERGQSFTWLETVDSVERVALDFENDEALISTVHVTLEAETVIAGPAVGREIGGTVTFGLALNAPVAFDEIEAELVAQEQLAVLLYEPSEVFDYAENLWAVMEDGAFLGVITEGERVEFPAVHGGQTADGRAFVPDDLTRSDLEEPPDQDPIPIVKRDGEWVRVSE